MPHILKVQNNEAALVLSGDGDMMLILPNGKPDEDVPTNVLLIGAIAMRLRKEPSFQQEILDWLDKTDRSE